MWYARRISVLFYLLSCYSSSLTYSNMYSYTPHYVGKVSKFKSTLHGYIEAGLVMKVLCKITFACLHSPRNKGAINYIEMKNYLTQRHYLSVFNSYSSNKPIILKWTRFVDIYASLVSTPSVVFLVVFLLPVFIYLIYFVCNNLSYRK